MLIVYIVNYLIWICFRRSDQCGAVDEPSTGWVPAVGHLQKEQHDEAQWRNQAEVSNVDTTLQIVIPPSLADLTDFRPVTWTVEEELLVTNT